MTAAREALGRDVPVGVPFWADSAIFSAAGIPTVIFGPGGGPADVEWVTWEPARPLRGRPPP